VSITLHVIQASDWLACKAIRLRALADAPDAFGSTLALESQRDDAAWQQRLAAASASGRDLPLFAMSAAGPVGLAWAKADVADPGRVDLFQMWVAPECRGQGIGHALLQHAIGWARAREATCLHLGVTCGDTPARRLYARAGFVVAGPPVPLREGSPLLALDMKLFLGQGQSITPGV